MDRGQGGVRVSLPVRDQDDPDWLVPDAFAVAPGNPVPLGDASYAGVLDLVVEVLAADNDAGEDTQKRAQYARAGVRHYWLVRLRWMTLEASVLGADGAYHAAAACRPPRAPHGPTRPPGAGAAP